MVLADGNAPRSIGYRPIALLLSYTRKNWRWLMGVAPLRFIIAPRFSGPLGELLPATTGKLIRIYLRRPAHIPCSLDAPYYGARPPCGVRLRKNPMGLTGWAWVG